MSLPKTITAAAVLTLTTVLGVGGGVGGADTRTAQTTGVIDETTGHHRSGATCRGIPAVLVQAGETYHGTGRDDVILVSGADATVYANGGDDLVCAFATNDAGSEIHGGTGDDMILVSGSHVVFGDAGNDVLLLNGGFNEGWGGAGDDSINGAGSTQVLAYGEDGHDIINGSPGDDWLGGYGGNDLILGWGGDDLIFGMDGDDELHGGNGFDVIGASSGDDHCVDNAGPVDGADISDCENVVISLGGGIGGLQS